MFNWLLRLIGYISKIGLSELDKCENVKVWPIHNICYSDCVFPGQFNLSLNNDGFGVRYWYYKGSYHKVTIKCKRKKYPEIITQSDIRPYLIRWKLENCKKL